jgi:hypothetical protein
MIPPPYKGEKLDPHRRGMDPNVFKFARWAGERYRI